MTTRVKELKTKLQEKTTEMDRLSNCWKTEDGGEFVISKDEAAEFKKIVSQCEEIKGLIQTEQKAVDIHAFLKAPDGPGVTAQEITAAQNPGLYNPFAEHKSLGTRFVEGEQWKAYKEGKALPMVSLDIEGVDMVTLQRKDVHGMTAGLVSGIPGFGAAQQLPLIERMRRPTRVRDLFPQATTTAAVLYGVRETGFTNRAAAVPTRRAADGTSAPTGASSDVFGLKPTSDISFTTVTYPISTVAHLLHVHRNVLADEPRLRNILDTEMVDGVKMIEDWEILYGDGVGENLTGIVNTPGTQLYTQAGGDKKTAALRRSITRVNLAYYMATGVVLHPLDWEDIELEEDSQGRYRVAVSVALGAEKRVWRLDVAETTGIVEGHWLVGAFGVGSKVWDRESVRLETSTEHSDNFARNVVTIRCEERLALEVQRPEAHVYGTFA